jgi:hypothetical protein
MAIAPNVRLPCVVGNEGLIYERPAPGFPKSFGWGRSCFGTSEIVVPLLERSVRKLRDFDVTANVPSPGKLINDQRDCGG